MDFWSSLDKLIQEHKVFIERPAGSTHPRYSDYVYPYDYGYLEGATSDDGAEIDVWLGSGDRSIVTAVVATFDLVKKDIENKLLIGCSESEMEEIVKCHQRGDMQALLIKRSGQ